MKRLAPVVGFNIKIVERAGATLKSSFPLANLWEDTKCGRDDCSPCEQEADKIIPCYRSSLVYENIYVKHAIQEQTLGRSSPT